MKKYIDVEEAEKVFKQMEENDVELYGGVHISECFDADRAINALKEIPAADVEEIRHGEHINDQNTRLSLYIAECSCCNKTTAMGLYCMWCGAKMDKETEE